MVNVVQQITSISYTSWFFTFCFDFFYVIQIDVFNFHIIIIIITAILKLQNIFVHLSNAKTACNSTFRSSHPHPHEQLPVFCFVFRSNKLQLISLVLQMVWHWKLVQEILLQSHSARLKLFQITFELENKFREHTVSLVAVVGSKDDKSNLVSAGICANL